MIWFVLVLLGSFKDPVVFYKESELFHPHHLEFFVFLSAVVPSGRILTGYLQHSCSVDTSNVDGVCHITATTWFSWV